MHPDSNSTHTKKDQKRWLKSVRQRNTRKVSSEITQETIPIWSRKLLVYRFSMRNTSWQRLTLILSKSLHYESLWSCNYQEHYTVPIWKFKQVSVYVLKVAYSNLLQMLTSLVEFLRMDAIYINISKKC